MPKTNSSAKGNPASHRMANPRNKAKRAANKAKNELLKALGKHPKQLREQANKVSHVHNLEWATALGFWTPGPSEEHPDRRVKPDRKKIHKRLLAEKREKSA